MGREEVIKLTMDVQAKISGLEGEVSKMQKAFSQLSGPENLTKGMKEAFSDLENRLAKVKQFTEGNKINLVDEKKVREELKAIEKDYGDLIKKVDNNKNKFSLGNISKEGTALKKAIENYNAAIKDSTKSVRDQEKEVQKLEKSIQNAKNNMANAEQGRNIANQELEALKKQAEDLRVIVEARKQVNREKGHTKNEVDAYAARSKAGKELVEVENKIKAAEQEAARANEHFTRVQKSSQNTIADSSAQLDKEKAKLNELSAALKDLQTSQLEDVKNILSELAQKGEIKLPFDINNVQSIEQLEIELSKIEQKDLEKVAAALNKISVTAGEGKTTVGDLGNNIEQTVDNTKEFNSELDQIKNRIKYFFGLNNAVRLFQQAIRSAFNTIKDLDEVMTETAVVTKFDVGDMWAQLPEYTKRANELGVSIHDAYEAATLYYQQGLSTNEVMAVSNETLKMARIAGLDAADATDRMTNALRGFNMEITEANAQNINDVYSNLAAKTASNVDEISTAMTKVASLANNANMSFENTAAFLSQIIETTRESAETAGTALKTVIARFSEVKSLYNEGELLGDFEGEEIDVNKVSKALRTAGINLNEYLTGMKGLDDIFMELSAKWDNLDQVQQRYIATMAAGSRQQSRFIALMQDNARMTELVKEANNATGASQEQFEKTLESFETKVNKLKNAWDTFLMGLANNTVIKLVIDGLTGLINAINGVLEAFGKIDKAGIAKSFASIAISIGGFTIGKGILKKIFANMGSSFLKGGQQASASFGSGFLSGIKKLFTKETWVGITPKIDTKAAQVAINQYSNALENMRYQQTLANMAILNGDSIIEINAGLNEIAVKTETEKAAAVAAYAVAMGVSNEVATAALALTSLGISEDTALLAAKSGLTTAKIAEYTATMIANGMNEEEIKIKLEQIASTYALAGAETMEQGVKKVGILTLLKSIALGTLQGKTLKQTAAAYLVEAAAANGSAIAQRLLNSALYACPLVWILALIMAVVAALALLIIGITKLINSTPEKKLQAAKEAAEQAAEAADEAAEAYNNLSDSLDSLNDKYKALDELTKGTSEWRRAVRDVNQEVLNLIEKYPELMKFLNMYDGVLRIDIESQGVQNILEQYYKKSVFAASKSIAAQANVIKLENASVFKALTGLGVDIEHYKTTGKKQIGDVINNKDLLITNGGLLTEDDIKELIEYDKEMENAREQLDGLTKAMAASALQLTDLSEEEEKLASTYLSMSKMNSLQEDWINKVNNMRGADFKSKEGDYRKYFKEKYGDNFKRIRKNGTVVLDDGTKIDAEDAKLEFAAKKATEEAAEAAKAFVNKLKTENDSVKRLYSEAEGKALSQKDIEKLSGLTYRQVNDFGFVEGNKEQLETLASKLGVAYEDLEESIVLAAKVQKEAIEKINNGEIQDKLSTGKFTELGASQLDLLTDNLATVMAQSGITAAESLMDSINIIMEESGENASKFVDALNLIDWTSVNDVKDLKNQLKETGLTSITLNKNFDTLAGQLLEVADAIKEVDTKALLEKVEALNPLRSKFVKGEATRTWSEEDINNMRAAGVSEDILSQFRQNLDGEYIYLGSSMDALREAIEAATAVEIKNAEQVLQNKIEARDELNNIKVEYTFSEMQQRQTATEKSGPIDLNKIDFTELNEDQQEEVLNQYINALYDSGNLEAIGIKSNGRDFEEIYDDLVNSGLVEKTLNKIKEVATDKTFESQIEQIRDTQAVKDRLALSRDQNAKEAVYDKNAADALKIQAYDAGVDTESIEKYFKILEDGTALEKEWAAEQLNSIAQTYQEAQALDIDTEKLKSYAEQLLILKDKEGNPYIDSEKIAYQVALANTKLNDGLGEIIDSYGDWTALIDESSGEIETTGSDDVKIFDELRKSVNKMLNTSKDLSDEFWNDANNIKLVKEAAEGDVEALAKLQKIAAKDYFKNLNVEDLMLNLEVTGDDAEEEVRSIINKIVKLIDDTTLPKLEAGVELDREEYGQFIDDLYNMMKAAGMTATQINEALDEIGYRVEITQVPVDVPRMRVHGKNALTDLLLDTGGPVVTYEQAFVPEIHFVSTGSGGGGVSKTNTDKGKKNRGSGNKSSGSSSKPSYWENPFDELFNLQEKINEALRTREALERKYQKLLKSTTASLSEIRKDYYDQINLMRQQIQLQQQLAAGRLRQIHNLANQYYTDDEGNRRTYASLGVTRYAHYDEQTGLITIDWEALEAIANNPNRTQEGEAAEAYINELQELVDSYEDVRDAIWEIEDAIEDLRKEAIESYMSFEDRVMEAVVAKYEKEIDAFEEMSNAISDAADKVFDAIQQQIEDERRARDNAKTEQEIADKEARLAYLRRDTSGANALEIMQLEKELEDARQNYQDTLIDQALEQMRRDAEVAAEQRAQQIEVMRAQLEIAKNSGELWQEVYDLINSARDADGNIDFNSELIRLLKEAEAFKALSAFGQDEWWNELTEAINRAIEGLAAGNADHAGQHQGEGSSGNEGSGEGSSPGSGSGEGGGGSTPGGGSAGPTDWPAGWPLPSETTGIIKKGSTGKQVKAIQRALNELGSTDASGNALVVDGNFGNKTEQAVKKFQSKNGANVDGKVGDETRSKFKLFQYKMGGLADFTGPAWLDGTKSHPEMVLSAQDTDNLITLKNVLAQLLNRYANEPVTDPPGHDLYFDIDINAEMNSDYDIDRVVKRVKDDIVQECNYRNINMVNFLR